jgi:hypothetical protein
MERQFVRPVAGDERGDGHEASVSLREPRAIPDLAEEDALGQVVEGRAMSAYGPLGGVGWSVMSSVS